MTTEEAALAAKAAQEVGPAARQFAAALGQTGPGSEVMAWISDMIRYRRVPHQARLLMRAAQKIEESGLPTSAVSDKLLRAVLEDGGLEDDDDLQERWSSLLAGAATGRQVPAAFPEILRQLDPIEVQLLDRLVTPSGHRAATVHVWVLEQRDGVGAAQLDNLERLGLVFVGDETLPEQTRDAPSRPPERVVEARALGLAFVMACRPPRPAPFHGA